MKGLPALIRLHTWELDGKRRELADLQRVEDGFHAEVSKLESDMLAEQEYAKDSESGVFAYGGFAAGVIHRRQVLAQSIAEIQLRIEAKREEVAEAYQELKRYEITLANREKQERLEQERLDQANLDEISLVQYERRKG
jgi:flagellar export protein FliJ